MLLMVQKGNRAGIFRGVIEATDMQKQITNTWKITVHALNQYFLCI